MIKVVVEAYIGDDDLETFLKLVRSFDLTHPGCHFQIGSNGGEQTMSEMWRMLESVGIPIVYAGKKHALLSQNICPCCGSKLIDGPRGGAAQNLYCSERTRCRQGFNVTSHDGVVIWSQDIGEVDDERYALYLGGGYGKKTA
jgi:hypothetical protein